MVLAALTKTAAVYLPLIMVPFSYIFKRRKAAISLVVFTVLMYSSFAVYQSAFHLLEPSKEFLILDYYLLRGMVNRSNGKYTQQLGMEINKRFYASTPTTTEIDHFWTDLEEQPGKVLRNFSRELAFGVLGTRQKPPNKKIESLTRQAILEAFLKHPAKTAQDMIWNAIKFQAFRTEFESDQMGQVLYKRLEGTKDRSEIRKILISQRKGTEMMALPDWVVTPIKKEFHHLPWTPVRIYPLRHEEFIFYYDSGNMTIMKIFEYFNRFMVILINLLIFIVSPVLLVLNRRGIKHRLQASDPLVMLMVFGALLIGYFTLLLMPMQPLDRFRAPLGVYYFIIIFGLLQIFGDEYRARLDEWKERWSNRWGRTK